jgi:hypothetical protein
MHRCLLTASVALALAVPALSSAQSTRVFPAKALRGDLVVINAAQATVNDQPMRLAPGLRIHDPKQRLVTYNKLFGQKLVVNYTIGQFNLLQEVWVLRPEEAANLWPKTAQEAATWSFNPAAQIWTKP